MTKLRRIVLIRHGETDGESSVRFHGSGDVDLSREGRAQMRAARARLQGEVLDTVVASPLRRAWRSAWILAGGRPVRLEPDFREIHFGRWEGMTAQEIEASDPARYRYLSLQFEDDVLVGANSLGLTQHVGVLRGLIQGRLHLGTWKDRLSDDPTRIMEAYLSATQGVGTTSRVA